MLKLDGCSVLLTGASSGIGRAMARLLAPRVRSLTLVARRIDRLEELKKELTAAHPGLSVGLEPCDLSDLAATEKLAARMAERGVDVLINNAGVGDYAIFDHADWGRTLSMMNLNMTSLVLLIHRLVGKMVARGSGGILNVSSAYGLAFTPGFSAYLGTKHFVTGFTEALRLDLTGTGVVVTQVCPGPVRTEFEAVAGETGLVPSWVYLSAERCAGLALAGFERERAMVVPGLLVKLMMLLVAVTPRPIVRLLLKPVARAMRKRQLLLTPGRPLE